MNKSARNGFVCLLFLVPLLIAYGESQQTHKVLNKVTALATDPAGKRAVSLAMSEYLSVGRAELAQHRHALNVNYGDLFVAYALMKGGAKMEDVSATMKTGKTVWQSTDEHHADWKQIANDAKKLNVKVDAHLLGHFANTKAETQRE